MLVQPRRRLWWLIVVMVILLIGGMLILIITGQVRINNPLGGGALAGTGDPGNKRLHELSNDAVFAHLPSRAYLSGPMVTTPAKYQQPVLDGGGWDGPSVVATFVDDQPAATVYQFYGAQAAAAGWQVSHYGQLNYADGWTKMYPDHAKAWLNLYSLKNTPQGHSYELGGGISIIQ